MSVLQITRGADWSGQATFRDEATPLNLTGFTITAVIAWAGGSVAATVTPINLAAGQVRLALDEAQTLLIPPGRLSRLTITFESAGGDRRLQSVAVEGA